MLVEVLEDIGETSEDIRQQLWVSICPCKFFAQQCQSRQPKLFQTGAVLALTTVL